MLYYEPIDYFLLREVSEYDLPTFCFSDESEILSDSIYLYQTGHTGHRGLAGANNQGRRGEASSVDRKLSRA